MTMKRTVPSVFGLITVIAAAACTSAGGHAQTLAQGCTAAGPLTGSAVATALRRHGFSARIVSGCASGKATVANAGPTARGVEARRAKREGLVICGVAPRPVGRMARHPRQIYEYDSLPTGAVPGREIYLANVDCDLYLDTKPRANAAPELRAAMQDLRTRLS